jgi:UDP-N-acetylmuramate dehydrogenase
VTPQEFTDRWAARLGPDRWRAGVSLASLTTFRVGGPAEWLADLTCTEELETLVADAAEAGLPVAVLGGGSNILVADEGVAGVVLRLHLSGISQPASGLVRAEAGVTINGLVRWTVARGLAALEAWAGTPGTVGGAVYGNAHWSGQNIGDLVAAVRLVDRRGQVRNVPVAAMEFAYDTSRLKRTGEILVHADFAVGQGDPAALREVARRSLHYRKATQPLAMPSAGCIFQNPGPTDEVPAGIPRSAGALVDRAGLKGHRVGGASISDRHANFIVNEGRATARDIKTLIELARKSVRDRFGVELLDEIVYLGNIEHG